MITMKLMNKYILAVAVAACIAPLASAQTAVELEQVFTEAADTVMHVTKPSTLVITENSAGTTIAVVSEGSDTTLYQVGTPENRNYSVSSRQRTFTDNVKRIFTESDTGEKYRWNMIVDGVCIGLNKSVGQPEPGDLQWAKSFEISWLNCLGVSYNFGRSSVSLGLGFDWRNYKSTYSDIMLDKTATTGVEWITPPEGRKVRFSQLKIFSLQLPLLFRTKIPSTSLFFKVGPIFNFNTYSSLKTSYDDVDGNRVEEFSKNVGQRVFTIDFFGSLSFCKTVGVYVRYSPYRSLKDGSPINFHPLTVGVTLGI